MTSDEIPSTSQTAHIESALEEVDEDEDAQAVTFLGALKIPVSSIYIQIVKVLNTNFCYIFQGVVEFSLCLFFAKLVSYTFLYWLPSFIQETGEMHIILVSYLTI